MRPVHIWVLLAVAFLHGCATQFPQEQKTNDLTQNLSSYHQLIETSKTNHVKEDNENPNGILSLENAVSLALLQNPALSIYPFEIRAQEALALQSGLLPNPEIETEFEDFAGSGNFGFGDRIEVTSLYSQLIERGEKREMRYQLGMWETEMARWDYRIAKINVITLLAQRYLNVLAEQERVAILEELVQLSEKSLYAISERVRAGKISQLEETRAKVEVASERNALDVARQELKSANSLLAMVWGATQPKFKKVSGKLESIQPLPELDELFKEAENNPDILRWAVETKRRQSVLELEQAQAVPDITLTGGLRYINESEDASLVGAFSIPLNFFNRNQGAIRAAKERIEKARLEQAAELIELQAELSSSYQRSLGTQMEIERLQTEILPGADQAYQSAREGYQLGKFNSLDVLDAQRTYFQARVRYIESLTLFHQQWIRLERLIGKPLKDAVNLSNRSDKNENK